MSRPPGRPNRRKTAEEMAEIKLLKERKKAREVARKALDRDLVRGKRSREVDAAIARVAALPDAERLAHAALPPPAPKDAALLDLRIRGYSYREIAEKCGLPEQAARRTIAREIDALLGDLVRSVDQLRALELERYDALQVANWPAAMAGGTEAAAIVLRAMERRAKLLGLDAPQRVDVSVELKRMALEYGLDPDELEEEFLKGPRALPPAEGTP